MNIGELINKFDNETDGTVKSFNTLFNVCPIKDFNDADIVTIGDIKDADNRRFLYINGKKFTHTFERVASIKRTESRTRKDKWSNYSKWNYTLLNKLTGETVKADKLKNLEIHCDLSYTHLKNLIKNETKYYKVTKELK